MPDDQVVDIDESRLLAALAYVGVLVAVPFLVRRDDPYVVWHVKQGLVILVGLILSLVAATWHAPTGSVLFLVLMMLDIIALIQALLGRRWRIPLIGNLAEKFTL
ncbi:MAG TPA: hypothetical protein VJC05_02700 [Candidatus Andersenbacteria bacterium]|nr:hypothetical protein [Candidatus Andersenbacteria bacterium]